MADSNSFSIINMLKCKPQISQTTGNQQVTINQLDNQILELKVITVNGAELSFPDKL